MMYHDIRKELLKLQDTVIEDYDPLKVSVLAMRIYHNSGSMLTEQSSNYLMQLIAMDMGEEFELSQKEVKIILDRLLSKCELY